MDDIVSNPQVVCISNNKSQWRFGRYRNPKNQTSLLRHGFIIQLIVRAFAYIFFFNYRKIFGSLSPKLRRTFSETILHFLTATVLRFFFFKHEIRHKTKHRPTDIVVISKPKSARASYLCAPYLHMFRNLITFNAHSNGNNNNNINNQIFVLFDSNARNPKICAAVLNTHPSVLLTNSIFVRETYSTVCPPRLLFFCRKILTNKPALLTVQTGLI